MMVSVLEGRLARTWHYNDGHRDHIITLFHDTITGLRSAMCDFQEIPGSFGNSSLLMDSNGHRMFFTIDTESGSSVPGYLEIKKEGWTSFLYRCVVRNEELHEVTQIVATDTSNIFSTDVCEPTVTKDEFSDTGSIVWYVVKTLRRKDKVSTTVHRRFKDFADMFSQVKQNFKGHHLRTSLPELPDRTLKLTTDHMDPLFITDRMNKLDSFMKDLLSVPHVAEMTCVKAFLGLMEQVKEFSISFRVGTLGLSLITPERPSIDNPALVGIIQKPELCPGLYSGDAITKINGLSVCGMTFSGVVNRIKALQRPIIIHFVQVIASRPSTEYHANPIIETKELPIDNRSDSNEDPTMMNVPLHQETVHTQSKSGTDDPLSHN